MTLRQKKLGVTEWGYEKGIKENEWLYDMESFLAVAATIKKGQYKGFDLFKEIAKKKCDVLFFEGCFKVTYEYDVKPYLYGLSVRLPDCFSYTDTNGLDTLTVK